MSLESDLEGLEVDKYNYPNSIPYSNTSIKWILGDIMDGTSIKALEKNPDFLNLKSNSLRNIYEICRDPSKICIFGNRDLTKIKMKLVAINTNIHNKQIYRDFNQGTIQITLDNFKNFFHNKIFNWEFSSEFTYQIFTYIKKALFKESTQNILDKFNNVLSNCGADKLLETIPIEVGINVNEEMKDDIYSPNDKKQYKAFIVLSIFRSMILKPSIHIKPEKIIDQNVYFDQIISEFNLERNVKCFQYFLYLFYTMPKNNIAGCFKYNEKLHILSHGGITNNFLQIDNMENFFNKIYYDNYTNIIEVMNKLLTESEIDSEQFSNEFNELLKTDHTIKIPVHNSYLNSNFIPTDVNINNVIESFNIFFKSLLITVLNHNFSKHLDTNNLDYLEFNRAYWLILLICTGGFANKKNIQYYNPIGPGILEIFDETIINKNINDDIKQNLRLTGNFESDIVQIHGHQPFGYGASFFKYKVGNKNVFHCGIDISNSFVNTNFSKEGKIHLFYNEKKELHIYTQLLFNDSMITKDKILLFNELANFELNEMTSDTIFVSAKSKLNIDFKQPFICNKPFKSYEYEYIQGISKIQIGNMANGHLFFHGLFTNNNKEYFIFSYIVKFNKILIIVDNNNEEDIEVINEHKIFLINISNIVLIKKSSTQSFNQNKLNPVLTRENTLNKYLKYKTKYLNIVNI